MSEWCPGCSQQVEKPCHHFNCPAKEKFSHAQDAGVSDFLDAVYDAIGDLETDKDGNVRWSALVNIQREIGQKAFEYRAAAPRTPTEGDNRRDCPWKCSPDNPECLCANPRSEINRQETTAAGVINWKMEAERANRLLAQALSQVEDAADIIDGLLAFDLGSAERAVNFLAERDGSHPFVSSEKEVVP